MKLKQNTEEQSVEKTTKRNLDLSENMINLLIKQISHELHNYTLYKTFANYFSSCGLLDLCVYYQERANEEQTHHQWIVDYLDERGVFFKYPAIAEVNEEFEEHIDVFKLTVAVEEETTKMIYEIVDLATKENDYLTLAWLMHNGNGAKLVAEQSEEMSISELALDVASQDDTWIEKGRTILRAYKGANNN